MAVGRAKPCARRIGELTNSPNLAKDDAVENLSGTEKGMPEGIELMRHVETLYLTWYSEGQSSWYTIGRFDCDEDEYRFKYLAGAVLAQQEAGFRDVAQFPKLSQEYTSSELFAFLSNRVLSEARPDHEDYIRRLGLEPTDLRLFDILSRSHGRRVTDTYELYPAPLQEDGEVSLHFFARGVRYLDEDLQELWRNEKPAAPLQLRRESDNPHDSYAIEIFDERERKVGCIPRYYTESLCQVLDAECGYEVELVRHNEEAGFVRQRFLLRLEAQAPKGWYFPQSDHYDPVTGVLGDETEAA